MGPKPPRGATAAALAAWVKSDRAFPSPIGYRLKSICALTTSGAEAQRVCYLAAAEYCLARLGAWSASNNHTHCGGAKVPQLTQAFHGYNIFKGDPLSKTGTDPGFLSTAIFEESYSEGGTSEDGAYPLPDGVDPLSEPVCRFNCETAS